ncbi:amino acid adenylation domain-containing protein, partial [Paenibacillus elgii]
TEIEEKLAELWSEVLGADRIGVHDSFFELGGHSLKMMSLSGKILKEYGMKVTMNQILEHPTIRTLGEFIQAQAASGDSAERGLLAEIQPLPHKDYYEVSSAQKRIYLLNRIDEVGLSYNISAAFIVEGNLERDKVNRCFEQLIGRHEALRTSFGIHDGELVQRIHSHISWELETFEADQEKLDPVIGSFVRRYNLNEAPLFRAGIVGLAADRHVLLFDQHHIISDGVSMQLLTEEFVRLYNGEALPELELQYKDFAAWQNRRMQTEELRKQKAYWLGVFDGELPSLDLPLDFSRPKHQSYEGDVIDFTLGGVFTAQLNELARVHGATLYMVLLAVFNVLLSKYAAQDDIVIGSPIAGRRHPDVERMLGVFINILCMRNAPKPELTFHEFLQQVKVNTFEAYEHQDLPFEDLVYELKLPRDRSRNPIFDVMFVLQNMSASKLIMNGLDVKPYEFTNRSAQFELKLEVIETDENELACTLEYSTKLFTKDTVQRMAERFVHLVRQVIADPRCTLSELTLLTEQERHEIVYGFNDTGLELLESAIHKSFERRASQAPERIALVHGQDSVTYGELNAKANRLARVLVKAGVKANEPVGLNSIRSIDMIVGILAILKAGGCYVPIDPDYPLQRKQYILNHSGARVLLMEGVFQAEELLTAANSLEVVVELSGSGSGRPMSSKKPGIAFYDVGEVSHQSADNLEFASRPADLMYIMYTSGSTGQPKGVMVTHENVSNYIQWSIEHFRLGPEDRMMLVTSICFDISAFEIFGALLSSAALHIIDTQLLHDPRRLLRYIDEQSIHVWHSVPTLMAQAQMLLQYDDDAQSFDLSRVRLVMLGGEAWSASLGEQIRSRFTQAEIHNMYGPTEATIWVTSYRLGDPADERSDLPIGKPIVNNQIWIKDRQGRLCAVGIPGDLYVSGKNVTPGYYKNEAETASKFVRDDQTGEVLYQTGDIGRYLPDGNIEFFGRRDHMVKVRGYRVETGEIERALLQKQGIDQTVVVVRKERETTNLVCYYVAREKWPEKELALHLERLLPHYMVPSRFVNLESLPLTPNGKIDRKALPDPQERPDEGPPDSAPVNELEAQIAEVWRSVLGVEKIGVHDDFYLHGGNSLLVIKLEVELDKQGLFREGMNLFEDSTIRKWSARLQEADGGAEIEASLYAGGEAAVTAETKEPGGHADMHILTNVEPFNDIFYKNCFYNSAFPVMRYFEKDAVDLLINELSVYDYDQQSQKLSVEYIPLQAVETMLAEQQIGIETKRSCTRLIEEVVEALSAQKPVILWIDCYYASIRQDKYLKQHFPHTWLVYGYNETLREFHIIEHAHSDQLSYEKRTVSFQELELAYDGYLDHLMRERPDEPTYYAFSREEARDRQERPDESPGQRTERYIAFLSERYADHHAEILESFQHLAHFIDDFEATALLPELLQSRAADYIESLNDVINSKRVEKYKFHALFGDAWEGQRLFAEIMELWEGVRVLIAKYHYSSIYQKDALLKAIEKLKTIERLEYDFVAMIRKWEGG